jgi:hypothetical protein
MFFLLRLAFWIGIVLVLLPVGGSQQSHPKSTVGAGQAIAAADATVHDLAGFCTREPRACAIGSRLAIAMSDRAQRSAKMLYEFLTERSDSRRNGSPHGNNRAALRRPSVQQASENTLTSADRMPPWRGPQPHKRARPSA